MEYSKMIAKENFGVNALWWIAFFIILHLSRAKTPSRMDDDKDTLISDENSNVDDTYDYDQEEAPSDKYEGRGRIQIKVFRGATMHDVESDQDYAPYGYWVKQPPDS